MGNQESIPSNNKILIKKKKDTDVSSSKIKKNNNNNANDNNVNKNTNNEKQHKSEKQQNNSNISKEYLEYRNNENQSRNNIVPIKKDKNYEDFSNYNYELKAKNTHLNNALVQRNLINVSSDKTPENFINYPSSSNDQVSSPKPNFDNIKFDPYNFNDEVENIKLSLEKEKIDFKTKQDEEKIYFESNFNKKNEYINEKIKMFEKDYNPWEILGLENNDFNIENIKKAYKKRALKYHPDKNIGQNKDTSDLFNLITNAYIYLLKKSDDKHEVAIKISKVVEKQDYNDDVNESVYNIHLDKDNFNIQKFNDIFDKYKVNDDNEQGYGDLMKNNNDDDSKIFNSKVSQDVFNAHFNKLKQNKTSEQLTKFQEPSAIDLSSKFSTETLGNLNDGGFGYSNSNNLSYTDIKSAHFDENLLIDPDSVKFNTYKSVEQLESARSSVSFKANEKERDYYKQIEFQNDEREKLRQLKMREKDDVINNNFRKLNQKLIIHKK